eukprot:COSAG06_NODE_1403_length_9565_cov_3.285231_12_plen_141_part_00
MIEDIGLILKHVAGVALTAARGNLVAHNRISRSPRYVRRDKRLRLTDRMSSRLNYQLSELSTCRYGVSFLTWTNADGSGWGVSRDNIVEYNLLTDTALETNDVGAINFGNGGDSGFPGFPNHSFSRFSWNQNNSTCSGEY